jgi:hypothetical protein
LLVNSRWTTGTEVDWTNREATAQLNFLYNTATVLNNTNGLIHLRLNLTL